MEAKSEAGPWQEPIVDGVYGGYGDISVDPPGGPDIRKLEYSLEHNDRLASAMRTSGWSEGRIAAALMKRELVKVPLPQLGLAGQAFSREYNNSRMRAAGWSDERIASYWETKRNPSSSAASSSSSQPSASVPTASVLVSGGGVDSGTVTPFEMDGVDLGSLDVAKLTRLLAAARVAQSESLSHL
jgi:hypothetical protein